MRNLNLPNSLTFLRLLLAPLAVHSILVGEYRRALAIFAVAALTDGLDGYLARRMGTQTRVGTYLDPVADKALLSATFLALGVAGLVPWWLVILIFGRDLLILAMAGAALWLTSYRDFPPTVWGKVSTFFQIVAAVWVIVAAAFPAWSPRPDLALWLAATATAWSGATYVHRGVRMATSARGGSGQPSETTKRS